MRGKRRSARKQSERQAASGGACSGDRRRDSEVLLASNVWVCTYERQPDSSFFSASFICAIKSLFVCFSISTYCYWHVANSIDLFLYQCNLCHLEWIINYLVNLASEISSAKHVVYYSWDVNLLEWSIYLLETMTSHWFCRVTIFSARNWSTLFACLLPLLLTVSIYVPFVCSLFLVSYRCTWCFSGQCNLISVQLQKYVWTDRYQLHISSSTSLQIFCLWVHFQTFCMFLVEW